MFNMELSIKIWKKSLRKNRTLEDGYIEELEQHLRDEIERNVNTGISEDEAFDIAVQNVGEVETINFEYFKTDTAANKMSGRPSWQMPKWMPLMFWNYMKVALRNFKRYKGYSFINISGLTVGFTCMLIIGMLIHFELSFDDFHENRDRIYRVYTDVNRPSGLFRMAPVAFPMGPAIESEVPEIEKVVRISETQYLFAHNDKNFYESVEFVNNDFFDVFSFNLVSGDKNTALSEPFSVVLSQDVSTKYFGDEDPLGKTFLVNNEYSFKVTGIIENRPENSTLRYNILVSISTLKKTGYSRLESWSNFGNDYLNILLKPNVNVGLVEEKINEAADKYLGESKDRFYFRIQPLKDVHFSDFNYDSANTTPKILVYVLGIIGLFLLVIAAINFINLSTARASKRTKEIGIRKVVGANRYQLIKQFLGEAFLTTIISFILSIIVVKLLLPEFNALLGRNLSLTVFGNYDFTIPVSLVVILTSLFAGGYPALVLSNYKPAGALKFNSNKSQKGFSLRASLVVVQFAIAVFFIVGTLTVYSQIDFLLSKDLGFDKDRTFVLQTFDPGTHENGMPLKNAILQIPNVVKASYSNGTPGSNTSNTYNFTPEEGTKEDEQQVQILHVDYDFFDTYGLKIIEGRKFSREFSSDTAKYVLNETAAKRFGWESAVGKYIRPGASDEKYQVIGTVKDFHYASLRENIWPMLFRLESSGSGFLSVQLGKGSVSKTIDKIKETYSSFVPNYPAEGFFINESFEKYYRAEKTMGKLLALFTFVTIFISCVGIIGLASFTAEQKSKEIGIRKVLGATVPGIILMIGKEFVKWILIANVIVLPLSYYVMNSWLNDFAYRVEFNYLILAATLCVSILITVMTVGYHSARAALANPVDSLKYE